MNIRFTAIIRAVLGNFVESILHKIINDENKNYIRNNMTFAGRFDND